MLRSQIIVLIKRRNISLNQIINGNLAASRSADCDVACGFVTLDSPEIRERSREMARQTASLSSLPAPLITTASFPAEVAVQETTSWSCVSVCVHVRVCLWFKGPWWMGVCEAQIFSLKCPLGAAKKYLSSNNKNNGSFCKAPERWLVVHSSLV